MMRTTYIGNGSVIRWLDSVQGKLFVMYIRVISLAYWAILFCVFLGGCGRGTGGAQAPEWDAAAAAERAFAEHDSNHDQKLGRDELQKCPGLGASLSVFDADNDGAISASELTTRLQEIRDQQSALVQLTCKVVKGGKGVEGATVTLVPESFMGEMFKPMSGTTGADGNSFPSVPDEELPAELRGRIRGVHCGVFRVTVSHPTIQIPAKFSGQTELGRTVTRRDHEPLIISL